MRATTLVPRHPDLAEVLITSTRIRRRIRRLAAEIRGVMGEDEFTMISLINGAVMFTADLMREFDNPVRLDCIRVASYGGDTRAQGTPRIVEHLTLDLRDRRVLLVDDILDTGKTLRAVIDKLNALQPKSLTTCVLLEKKSRRAESITADYVGFEVPDEFVIGYGIDYAERYRNLPFIGVLKPEVYS